MDSASTFYVADGFPASQTEKAAQLFWDAFKGKLGPIMFPEEKALKFLETVADPSHSIGAMSADGTLIGIAGFETAKGSFVGGGLKELQTIYGGFGGTWRGLALALFVRSQRPGTLTMDGIMVHASARGQGVGSALLSAIKAKAVELDCDQVRLDVIDTNPRARALYERQGFVAGATDDIGPLSHIFGFQKATAMICKV